MEDGGEGGDMDRSTEMMEDKDGGEGCNSPLSLLPPHPPAQS